MKPLATEYFSDVCLTLDDDENYLEVNFNKLTPHLKTMLVRFESESPEYADSADSTQPQMLEILKTAREMSETTEDYAVWGTREEKLAFIDELQEKIEVWYKHKDDAFAWAGELDEGFEIYCELCGVERCYAQISYFPETSQTEATISIKSDIGCFGGADMRGSLNNQEFYRTVREHLDDWIRISEGSVTVELTELKERLKVLVQQA